MQNRKAVNEKNGDGWLKGKSKYENQRYVARETLENRREDEWKTRTKEWENENTRRQEWRKDLRK